MRISPDNIEDKKDKESLWTTCKEVAESLQSWISTNSHSIIKSCTAISTLGISLYLIFLSGFITSPVSAYDVSHELQEMQNHHTYIQELEKTPQQLRRASVEIMLTKGCTGTVLEQIGDIYTIITADHCLRDEEGNLLSKPGDNVFIGTYDDGNEIQFQQGFELVNYFSDLDSDIAFVAIRPFAKTDIGFIPYRNKLKVFNRSKDSILSGVAYPEEIKGWAMPINKLRLEDSKFEKNGIVIPVSHFPLSPGGSGTALVNENNDIVAISSAIRLDIDPVEYDRKFIASTITQKTIDDYNTFCTRFIR